MTTLHLLTEWGLRSAILIAGGAMLMWALRVRDPGIRLATWTTLLCGSLAMPVFMAIAPKVPVAVMRVAGQPVEGVSEGIPLTVLPVHPPSTSTPFDRARAALAIYSLVAIALLLRLCAGWAMSLRLLRASAATGQAKKGIEIRESGRVAAPVTLGIARPVIVLPRDWRDWSAATLDAVLEHELSHIRRFDPAFQLLSAIHRALLWHSPLSWFLHTRIVRVAEEASDDAAVRITRDRTLYAEVLLGFMQRGVRGSSWLGVPMARYGRPEKRIGRILDGTALSSGVTRWGVAAILALGSPLVYIVAAAHPQSSPAARVAQVQPAAQIPAQAAPAATLRRGLSFITGLGNVAPFAMVRVKPRIDGQLMSVSFKEGELVQAGQVLASIDPGPLRLQLVRAERQVQQDEAQLLDADRFQSARTATQIAEIKIKMQTDQAIVADVRRELSYAQITAPITGVTGLRQIDPGNIVHASDATGIVVITQLQPIAVLFTIPEDRLNEVRALLRQGASPTVEAWNRDNRVRIASGSLTAVDNQINPETGMAKMKAVFDNKDEALFPDQFVNVRLFIRTEGR